MEKKFCKGCKMKLKILAGFFGSVMKKEYYELEDGLYCPKCAKLKVEKHRRKL